MALVEPRQIKIGSKSPPFGQKGRPFRPLAERGCSTTRYTGKTITDATQKEPLTQHSWQNAVVGRTPPGHFFIQRKNKSNSPVAPSSFDIDDTYSLETSPKPHSFFEGGMPGMKKKNDELIAKSQTVVLSDTAKEQIIHESQQKELNRTSMRLSLTKKRSYLSFVATSGKPQLMMPKVRSNTHEVTKQKNSKVQLQVLEDPLVQTMKSCTTTQSSVFDFYSANFNNGFFFMEM
ncbi:hypothetical protein EIN_389840 [Entamoeba invadens IP1]|uniref:Uncharacterized protein n=1 Tax=Entamoeba invadens IP1 TaxID=370355 RepID=A0A0A1U532_ENTIV|nr:hypothetical protein EIN_389840 [Entamoeba invadens IP1]ELP89399.1 hypothetical protein EIN_389840 [Entamoeba invadens IP1]|eukprot:XP_004256170.1 hypothetical protein EIN_389840 [Entamoeba invadens IP1]